MIGLVLILAGPAAAAADSIFGRWVVEDGKAVIELAPCGENACGQLVWLQSPWDANGAPKRDDKNPDPQLRDRPLCGLQLVSGLERAGDGSWEDGKIYSTRDGRSYGIEVWLDGQDRLAVRGYLGLSLLGRTQTWTRDSMRRANCTAMTRPGTDR